MFSRDRKQLIGMVHLGASPGTPAASLDVAEIARRAASEATALAAAGFDALIVENMHDRPYLTGAVGPEVVAAMTRAALAVRAAAPGLPCGVQVLAGANREALAVALAAGLDFVRVEGFVFAHVADEGLIESGAGELLRYRKQIGAEGVQILADIKKKHSSHSLTADTDIAETAKAAEFFLADGLVITGTATGAEASLEELAAVREATALPLCVGSGIDAHNALSYLEYADALIVGSSIKIDGRWQNPVCPDRAAHFVKAARPDA